MVDADLLCCEVRAKYRAVAENPEATFHFHTGRELARRCRYDMAAVAALPAVAVESFAGVANPFELRPLRAGERVVDIGSGAGFDSLIAAGAIGPTGAVIGVDMTPQMLAKSRRIARDLNIGNVEFREGLAEALPVDDGWADVVISNGVFGDLGQLDEHHALGPVGRDRVCDLEREAGLADTAGSGGGHQAMR